MATANSMEMVWRMRRHCWTDWRQRSPMDAKNVAENCAISVLRNCQPMTNGANPWHPESVDETKGNSNGSFCCAFRMQNLKRSKLSYISCNVCISMCTKWLVFALRNADGQRTMDQDSSVALSCVCKTMQNTSVINDDLLLPNCVLRSVRLLPKKRMKEGKAHRNNDWNVFQIWHCSWFYCVRLTSVGREMSCNSQARPVLWTLCETDRCLRWNLNSGPIKHFDGIYGVKLILLFLFSKEISRKDTNFGVCVLFGKTESRTHNNKPQSPRHRNTLLQPHAWTNGRVGTRMTCILWSSSEASLSCNGEMRIHCATKKCAQYQNSSVIANSVDIL